MAYPLSAVSQNINAFFKKKLLSYLVHSQIWLNLLVDDHQFGYTTKFGEKRPKFIHRSE
jgi:hypothetical protein